jgi:hypothetical protein
LAGRRVEFAECVGGGSGQVVVLAQCPEQVAVSVPESLFGLLESTDAH